METTQGNQASWNANAYQAWLNRFGQPEEAAARIKKDPAKRIGELYKYAGDSPLFSGDGSSVRRGLPPVDPGRQVDSAGFSSRIDEADFFPRNDSEYSKA
ncbi:hypothetical protein L5D93_26190 [Paenibacillus thiaminolyticus]|nr:hypothetical protein [Paenibacillus thiaminolyticus]